MAKLVDTQSITLQDGQKKYIKLKTAIQKAGLLNRSYRYYISLFLFVVAGYLLSGYLIVRVNSIPWLIVLGIIFSFFMVQISGIQHDAGHRAVFKSPQMNDALGLICGAFIAMGYSSWKFKHNIHHAHTNQEDEDPDVDLPILSFTEKQYKSRRGIQRFLSKYQMLLYYPIGALVAFSVRITSMRYFIIQFKKKYIGEIIILAIGIFVLYFLPFIIFPLAKSLTLFIVINVTVGFYLLNVFAPNHKGMPVIAKGQKLSFLEQQIMTSRNVIGSTITDFVYLGLNYQIEHHLFPNCPRNNLKKMTPFIKEVCKDMKLEYTEVGVIETNKIILSELHNVARLSSKKSS